MKNFRAFFKPEGGNPEIVGAFYEQSAQAIIAGSGNCRPLSLNFRMGDFSRNAVFQPIDTSKPIVFAIEGVSDGCYFVVLDTHMREAGKPGMRNFEPYSPENVLLDCADGGAIRSGRENYWSIKVGGERYIYGDMPSSLETTVWRIRDLGLLCAFIGGGITAGELRASAYKQQREAAKEVRREQRIKALSFENAQLSAALGEQAMKARLFSEALADLRATVGVLLRGRWPWVSKSRIESARDDSANRAQQLEKFTSF